MPLQKKNAVAVYCGSSFGTSSAFAAAAISLGHALAASERTLVYGGMAKGLMGVVSGAVLEGGGKVIGVTPSAMIKAGGEAEKVTSPVKVKISQKGREKIETISTSDNPFIVVESMHERKVEMAKRADGFIGLPGGYGTFEEILEATTWSQLGIHDKPVVLLNVLSFWEPLRMMIKSGINSGFIRPSGEQLITIVDGPEDHQEHESFDWGKAAIEAIDRWEVGGIDNLYDWSGRGSTEYKRT
ncbi:hypothetical protein CPB83DRAFT_897155 [Crepidotus variabilis]|uniref:Cytokinin riboside 5'-monophosphate phosphoribohydrolase n=1 Tax=Crepidotus variabilis TaxID=179855 RepID=A0A9P6EA45_9AGAR|nr:hypothetical protein CPB83DRAFT_897155 [Crepidotus variabilis]